MRARVVVALGAVVVPAAAIAAQEAAPVADAAPIEEVVVLGKALAELRFRIERAEDEAYARFNEVNSDDRFDIRRSRKRGARARCA